MQHRQLQHMFTTCSALHCRRSALVVGGWMLARFGSCLMCSTSGVIHPTHLNPGLAQQQHLAQASSSSSSHRHSQPRGCRCLKRSKMGSARPHPPWRWGLASMPRSPSLCSSSCRSAGLRWVLLSMLAGLGWGVTWGQRHQSCRLPRGVWCQHAGYTRLQCGAPASCDSHALSHSMTVPAGSPSPCRSALMCLSGLGATRDVMHLRQWSCDASKLCVPHTGSHTGHNGCHTGLAVSAPTSTHCLSGPGVLARECTGPSWHGPKPLAATALWLAGPQGAPRLR